MKIGRIVSVDEDTSNIHFDVGATSIFMLGISIVLLIIGALIYVIVPFLFIGL